MAQKPIALKFLNIISAPENNRLLLLMPLLLLCLCLFGQSKTDLVARRKKLLTDIEKTDKLLKKTAQTKEATYNRYVALQEKILQRESLVETVQKEIDAAEESIQRTENVVAALNSDVAHMEAEYGRMVRKAFRHRTLHNPLLYILSAANLNQAFRRWLFLRKYDAFRRQQAEAIRFTRDILAGRLVSLEQNRVEKQLLLQTMTGQKSTLDQELLNKNNLLEELRQDEDRLKKQLKAQQAAAEALNNAIESVIAEEVRRREAASKKKEESRKTAPSKSATKKPSAKVPKPESKPASPSETEGFAEDSESEEAPTDNVSAAFRSRRGKLDLPVANGFVSRRYGRQKHPTIQNVEITNNGIDIRTEDGETVRAVYSGVVAGVQFIPGHDYTVILQHGNYYTVYSNLDNTPLEKGRQVNEGDQLGRVNTNPITGAAELHFEIWYRKTRMNPSAWIK